MTAQLNRLAAAGDHRFAGTGIDRGRPLRFRLDGRMVEGFAGDTVLSALLACGIAEAGRHHGEPLALDERFAPPVVLESQRGDLAQTLPMERVPAIDGLRLLTLPRAQNGPFGRPLARIGAMLERRRVSLGGRFDRGDAARPWLDATPVRQIEVEWVVIGGGLAGLGAARAAAQLGDTVVLVERQPWLGGAARFFGAMGDAESPDAMVERLAAELATLPNVRLLRGTEAFALSAGAVLAHEIAVEDGVPRGRVLRLGAPRIVVASGLIERLPVFAGNRRPGVVGALAAFNRADRFGVWLGQQALVATSINEAYRVATLAHDSGRVIVRVADARSGPQSRFIEFAKAYGVPMLRGARPVLAEAATEPRRLKVRLRDTGEGGGHAQPEFVVDQLVVSGGWQPDLGLWHMAGGDSRWDASQSRIAPEGTLAGIALAGAVAGYRNGAACAESGAAAVAALTGRPPDAIEDPVIDLLFETPDEPAGRVAVAGEPGAYLDGGPGLVEATASAPRRAWSLRHRAAATFAGQARPVGVAEVAAGVELGLIRPEDAAVVAQERGFAPVDGAAAPPSPVAAAPEHGASPPAYLAGRFGPGATVWLAEAGDGRRFEVGCLVYPDADAADPLAAVGVVFAPAPKGESGGLVLVARDKVVGDTAAIRDLSGAPMVRLRTPPPTLLPPARDTAPAPSAPLLLAPPGRGEPIG